MADRKATRQKRSKPRSAHKNVKYQTDLEDFTATEVVEFSTQMVRNQPQLVEIVSATSGIMPALHRNLLSQRNLWSQRTRRFTPRRPFTPRKAYLRRLMNGEKEQRSMESESTTVMRCINWLHPVLKTELVLIRITK